jgi:hypothetical protein
LHEIDEFSPPKWLNLPLVTKRLLLLLLLLLLAVAAAVAAAGGVTLHASGGACARLLTAASAMWPVAMLITALLDWVHIATRCQDKL